MNPIQKAELARFHAQTVLARRHVDPAVVARVRELSGGGLDEFEVVKHTKTPMATVRLILRASA